MRIHISIIWVIVSFTALILPHHHHGVGDATEVSGDCSGATTYSSIPFTASAYDACTYFHDKSDEKFGVCGDDDSALDGQPNEDPVCHARGGQCHVAFTEPNEYLEYSFTAPDNDGPNTVFNIVARVASARPRRILLEIDNGGDTISKVLTTSGKGFFEFEDLLWEMVRIPGSGPERIFVEFLDGFTNFCSLRVEPTTLNKDKANKDKALIIPFDASAQRLISYKEKSSQRFGTCGEGEVDAQPTRDPGCNERGADCNIGWTERGEELIYDVINEEDNTVEKDVILRLASLRRGRRVSVEVEGYPNNVKVFTAPGNGYQDFEDFTWSNVDFAPGSNRLIVKFLDDRINFCSVSVK